MAGTWGDGSSAPKRLGRLRACVAQFLVWVAETLACSAWGEAAFGPLVIRLLLVVVGSGEHGSGLTGPTASPWGLKVNLGSNKARYREDPSVAHVAALNVRGKGSVFAVWYSHDHPLNFEGRLDTLWKEHAELAAVYWALLRHPCDRKLVVYTDNKHMVRYLADCLDETEGPASTQLKKRFAAPAAPGGAADFRPFGLTASHVRELAVMRSGRTLVSHTKKGLHPRVRSIVRKLEVMEGEGAQVAEVPGIGGGVAFSEQAKRITALVERAGPAVGRGDEAGPSASRSTLERPQPKGPSTDITGVLALDCEMVGVGRDGHRSVLARISVVNSDGNLVYDSFVSPTKEVTDYRTWVSGVRPHDLKNAPSLEKVQSDVKSMISGRVVVGHALKNDWEVLGFAHRNDLVRDTATYGPLCKRSGKPKRLKKLAAEFLGLQIQTGEHSPSEDAMAALYLYQKFQARWDVALEQRARHKKASKHERREQALKKFLGGNEAGEGESAPGTAVAAREEIGDNIYSCLAQA